MALPSVPPPILPEHLRVAVHRTGLPHWPFQQLTLNISTGQPNDYYYAIVNNSSADGTTNPNSTMPESPSLHRVFGFLGYWRWSHRRYSTFQRKPVYSPEPEAVILCWSTPVTIPMWLTRKHWTIFVQNLLWIQRWIRNVCPRCSCDSNGRAPMPQDSSLTQAMIHQGVRPNLTFEIDGLAYYTTRWYQIWSCSTLETIRIYFSNQADAKQCQFWWSGIIHPGGGG